MHFHPFRVVLATNVLSVWSHQMVSRNLSRFIQRIMKCLCEILLFYLEKEGYRCDNEVRHFGFVLSFAVAFFFFSFPGALEFSFPSTEDVRRPL
uniref:Secreted protein n=1 Tax=Ixodes ricinus TaxID=34613 RepID=A0A6B0UEN7_IXORI